MNHKEFILKCFEIAWGDEARPEDMALKKNDPFYRMPFTYEETVERLDEFQADAWRWEESIDTKKTDETVQKIKKEAEEILSKLGVLEID